jgi:hypothetical protein
MKQDVPAIVMATPTPKVVVETPKPKVVEPEPTPVPEPKYTAHTFSIISPSGVQTVNYRRLENGEVQFDDGNGPAAPPAQQLRPRTPPQRQPQVTPKNDPSSRDF